MLLAAALLSTQVTGCGNAGEQQVADYVVESAGQQDIPGGGEADTGGGEADIGGDAADKLDIEQVRQHLLTVWSDHLDVLEKMYASELWALDYVDAYLESGDWNDLVRARAACIASARYLSELSMTEEDLTEEEYLILADAGLDTSYQTVEFASVSVFVEEAHNVIRNQLLERLESDIYFEGTVESLKEQSSAERDSMAVMCQYVDLETNYLLLSLGDDTNAKTYWSSMRENYPVLSSEQAEWCAVASELEAAGEACMDQYEEIVMRQSEIVSRAEAQLYQMTQIVKNEDREALLASVRTMTSQPDLLPCPEWYDPQTTGYLSIITGEDGSVIYPESGDDLGDGQYGVYMQVENVAEEDIAAYMDTVISCAIDAWKSEDDGAWYIRMPDYNVQIECEDDTATILFHGEDVTFAPVWYFWE